MAETVVSFVLHQLSTFLLEEGRVLGGLRQEVQLITDELGNLRAFLKFAETREEDDPRLQEWIKQVRETAYDTEDVLDEFVLCFAGRRSHGFYGSVRRIFNSIKNLRARHRLASEIQSIKSRLRNISEGHQRYQSEYGSISTQESGSLSVKNNSWLYSRDDALLVEEAKLVGIEKPKQHLISQLLDGDSKFKVISVVGMGGLGKTTLVKKVYEDLDVRRYFPIRAWVTVSQTCDFQELLKNLIGQLHEEIKKPVPQMIDSMSTVQLKEIVKNFLQQRRYAIVFDDVWNVEFWNEIKFALPESSSGNRVMLTTRNAEIASASCIESQGYIYRMEPLSFEESWTLFCNKIFRNDCCPAHLKNVAQEILGKCEGLPLAIVAISGLLALKGVGRVDQWEMIRHSVGVELEGTGKLDRVKRILSLSYNDLHSQLKVCLLYISIFPEDYEISCNQLIQLWIAERFVQWREGVIIEDVAWSYLRELANRSFIQVTGMRYEGMPSRCRIHDLLREVIISMSREQNMVTLVTGQNYISRPPEKVRRLVIHGNNFLPNSNSTHNNQESQLYDCFDHLRSLITFGPMEPQLSKILLSKVLSGSSKKLLKVMDYSNAYTFEEIPNEIFKLFHLKYLCLREARVKTVPKSIEKLQNLEYLDLSRTNVKELPTGILKLKKLRHLWVFQAVDPTDSDYGFHGFKAPSKMGGLLALQTLVFIDATENEETRIIKEIEKLSQLRVLGITNLRREDGEELCSSLANLTNLRELEVVSSLNGKDYEAIDLNHHHSSLSSSSFLQSLCRLRLVGRLEKMPQWTMSLQRLLRIDLFWSGLREDPLESLEQLPNLVEINLIHSYQGEGLCFKAGRFLNLKTLDIRWLEGLRWMRVEEGALPRLQKLILQDLSLLVELPLGIQHLTQLQRFYLAEMSSQLVQKLENQNKESEDYRNIAHILEIIIAFRKDGEWRDRPLWGEKNT